MTIPLKYKKDELLAELEALLPAAEKADAKALAKHQREEARYLSELKKACARAAKWDYDTAKEYEFDPRNIMTGVTRSEYGTFQRRRSPSCPRSEAKRIQNVIDQLNLTSQNVFTLTRHGAHSDIYDLVTKDVTRVAGLC